MSDSIVYVDRSEIRAGKLTELRRAIKELVDFVDANEKWPFAYNVFINESGTQMTVVQVQPDSESLERHMEIAGPEFTKFASLLNLMTIDVYGKPSDSLRERLVQKAQLLGSGTVAIHELHAGFTRFDMTQVEPVPERR